MNNQPEKFSLADVLSDRIKDENGWRDRREDEYIKLTQEQQDKFVEMFGKGCKAENRAWLRKFISNPRMYARRPIKYAERILFRRDGVACSYITHQHFQSEAQEIRRSIL